MYFFSVMLVIFAAIIFYCLKNKEESFTDLDRNEHPLKFLYPLASRIYDLILRRKKQDVFGSIDQLREIYVDEKPELSQKKQGCKCIASIISVLGITILICFVYTYSKESLIVENNHLRRQTTGKGEAEYDLIYSSSITDESDIKIRVSEQKLQGEEFIKLKEDAKCYIDRNLFYDMSADCVRGKLNLMKSIPQTSIQIKWKDENSWFIGVDGTLKNTELIEPLTVFLRAELTYFDEKWDYEKEITIYPPVITEKDIFDEELERTLKENDTAKQTDPLFELPDKVSGVDVEWKEKDDNKTGIFLLIGIIAAGFMIPAMKQDIKKKQKIRNDQMMRDYPDIISKFVMLITAGMTCRGAWNKICSDYVKSMAGNGTSGEKKKAVRYAYEEMLISDNDMQLGIPEIKVYERFGSRCGVSAYNRFGTLLARNIKRGSAGIIEMLEAESKESFAERRENVRKKGEETGTKLLLPMMGMLILAIAIVVVPAFSSFNF